MDKKKGILNIITSVFFKIAIIIVTIFSKRTLINNLGNDINGLSYLFNSIVGVLAVSELGIGSAITFCLYKPIVQNDNEKISAIFNLLKKLYILIGIIILLLGLILTPFLPLLVSDFDSISTNVYITFILFLISVVITYLFNSNVTLINAYKNNYITTSITSSVIIIQRIFQIILLIFYKSYYLYLAIEILSSLVQWILIEIYTKKHYSSQLTLSAKLDENTKHEIVKSIKGMFMHKIGSALVNTADSIIISIFIGVIILGKYSNYITIASTLSGLLALIFTSLSSVIGHFCINSDKDSTKKYLDFFQTLNFIIGSVFFLGYYSIADELVIILFGENLEVSKGILQVITLNVFVQFMRYTASVFKDATGAFYNDRFIPLFEGIINIVLSVLFVIILPDDFKVIGVILSTIITNLLICHIEEPYFLFKYGLQIKNKNFYLKNYIYIALFTIELFVCSLITPSFSNILTNLFIKGFFSLSISILPCLIIIALSKNFKNELKCIINYIYQKIMQFNI